MRALEGKEDGRSFLVFKAKAYTIGKEKERVSLREWGREGRQLGKSFFR